MKDNMMAKCNNPKCFDGEVFYRGSTGPTGDDPSEFVDCPVCKGTGQVHKDFARYEMCRAFCRDCDRYTMVALAPMNEPRLRLCYECWLKKYHPELLPKPEPMEEPPF